MAVPQLTHAQSRRRIEELRRAGCDVAILEHPNGDKTVMKRCPPHPKLGQPVLLENPMLDNQVPSPNALGYLVLAGFGAAILYAIFRPRRAAAASAPPPIASCSLETTQDFARLESWAVAKNIGVIYLPATTTPPLPATSELARGIASSSANLVVVTGDGSFWTYTSGEPVLAPSDQADFCNFRTAQALSGIQWL